MSKPFGTDIPSSTSAGLRVDAIRLVSAFANGTYTDQDALQASAMLRNLLEEINRLRADAARYAYLRDHMLHGVSHPHGSAIGMSEVLFGDDPDEAIDAAMKEKRK